jgi:hypothetical protein
MDGFGQALANRMGEALCVVDYESSPAHFKDYINDVIRYLEALRRIIVILPVH